MSDGEAKPHKLNISVKIDPPCPPAELGERIADVLGPEAAEAFGVYSVNLWLVET